MPRVANEVLRRVICHAGIRRTSLRIVEEGPLAALDASEPAFVNFASG